MPHYSKRAPRSPAVGQMLISGGLRVRLEVPGDELCRRFSEQCRDRADWPILADADAEHCDVILTYDNDLLKCSASIRCMTPDDWLAELTAQTEVAAAIQRVTAMLAAAQGSVADVPVVATEGDGDVTRDSGGEAPSAARGQGLRRPDGGDA